MSMLASASGIGASGAGKFGRTSGTIGGIGGGIAVDSRCPTDPSVSVDILLAFNSINDAAVAGWLLLTAVGKTGGGRRANKRLLEPGSNSAATASITLCETLNDCRSEANVPTSTSLQATDGCRRRCGAA